MSGPEEPAGGETSGASASESTDPPADEPGAGESTNESNEPPERGDGVPVWEDDYLDAVALRLQHHYDLERDHPVEGERFALYGEMKVRHERHALHPMLTFAHHRAREYVFARRVDHPTVADLDRLERLGEELAETWIDADEDHYSTDFSFVVVADGIPDDVAEYVAGYENRTLLKFGYYGHYEINLVVVDPASEASVASENADVEQAFRVWEPIVKPTRSRLDRFLGWLSR